MNWEVRKTSRVQKQLQKIPSEYAKRIEIVIKGFKNNPFEGDIERIEKEKNVWRRRIGAYRILYEIYSEEKVVLVADVRRRTSSTYKRK